MHVFGLWAKEEKLSCCKSECANPSTTLAPYYKFHVCTLREGFLTWHKIYLIRRYDGGVVNTSPLWCLITHLMSVSRRHLSKHRHEICNKAPVFSVWPLLLICTIYDGSYPVLLSHCVKSPPAFKEQQVAVSAWTWANVESTQRVLFTVILKSMWIDTSQIQPGAVSKTWHT